MELKGKKPIIFVEDQFNDQEFWYPYYRLKEAGAETLVCGSGTSQTYKGKSGTITNTDINIADAKAEDFDILIIPGGFAPDFMRRSKDMVNFVTEMNSQNKIIASICHGGWMLVSGKVLKGRIVTSFFAIKDDIINAGAEWVDKEVVVDGNIITSRTPDDLPVFMATIISKFS